jgi:hypothetical protein
MARQIKRLPFAIDARGNLCISIGKEWVEWKDVAPYIKEARPTVRRVRPCNKRKHAICARGGKGHYVACRYWHSVGCSYKGKCPHKQHAVA